MKNDMKNWLNFMEEAQDVPFDPPFKYRLNNGEWVDIQEYEELAELLSLSPGDRPARAEEMRSRRK